MSTEYHYHVWVIVHKNQTSDYQKYRHTGVDFVPVAGGNRIYCHAKGSQGDFVLETRKGFDPTKTRRFTKKIEVGKMVKAISESALEAAMEGVAVRNEDPEFNCHMWVDGALLALRENGYITEDQYEKGMDEMMTATMEAIDEPLPRFGQAW